MKMRKTLNALVLCAGLVLAGCAGTQAVLGVFETATTTMVPADKVVAAANAFDILKNGATNYGQYCIDNQMTPTICSAVTRRVVIKGVRGGTGARNQLKASVRNKTPAAASVYNVLVTAVKSLQQTPAANTQFVETK
jgi:hypothetical protein